METFIKLKDFENNPHFHKQRRQSLNRLNINTIDAPIIAIIDGFSKLPYCFTLQSCYGHFLHHYQRNLKNIEPLPTSTSLTSVEYRIAYLALCLENSDLGRELFRDLKKIPEIDPEYVQFGCAEWFWKRQVNSYALQIEPKRYMTKDRVRVSYEEALHIEKIRNKFFNVLKEIVQKRVE
ncbi:MAG: hypothetical protein JRI95_05735 [Deltaproteobacteria bacterium]|nr:hypothetical protein [Deltaproteobacteria bacterium]